MQMRPFPWESFSCKEPKQLLPNLSSGDVRQLGREPREDVAEAYMPNTFYAQRSSVQVISSQGMEPVETAGAQASHDIAGSFRAPLADLLIPVPKEDRHWAFGLVSPHAQNPAARPISQRAGSSARLFKSPFQLETAGSGGRPGRPLAMPLSIIFWRLGARSRWFLRR